MAKIQNPKRVSNFEFRILNLSALSLSKGFRISNFVPRLRSGQEFRVFSNGFGLIETVVGAAIIGAVLLGLTQVGQFAFRTVDESNLKLRAVFIAEEGIEAARILRDSGWAANISPLPLDTDYFLAFSGGAWQLGQTPVAPLDNVFDRRLRFLAVYRGANDAITESGGTLDPNTKKLTVTVSWSNRGRTSSIAVPTYLTNLFNN